MSDNTYIWPFYGEVENCIVHFTNTYWSDTCGIGTCFVYIQGTQHKGMFLWSQNMYSGHFSVTKCSSPPAGYLQIICMKEVSITFHESVSKNQAYVAHMNYVQDTLYYKTFGCSYVTYMEKVIDELSVRQVTSDDSTGEHHQHDNKAVGAVPPTSPGFKREHASFSNAFPHFDVVPDHIASDFFDSNKKLGFIALEGSQFKFIGPDRDNPPPLSLSDYISMATFIRLLASLTTNKLGSQFIQTLTFQLGRAYW